MNFSTGWLLASLLVGTLGTGFFLYGKKQTRLPQLVTGLALMAESALVPSWIWMLAGAALLLVGLWVALRAGL